MTIKQELKDLKHINYLIDSMEAEGMQQIIDKLTQEKNATISKIYQLGDTEQIKVMMLRHYQGLTWDEISNETGLSTSKLMSVNKCAMKKLLS
ncbi:hypothetical protein [Streptococcus uberis]|uniref:hypothetical protein n=1 Tax=Streptococcus uberis TaxID=1349 RepID=UPI0012B627AA|nr:hypothetical protein [Streptococcus uberis]MTB63396.1 hypothetical protein [Streptococcus uberis]MTB92225.1 hypothetical protein [Streptococcus uberis]